MNFVGGRAKDEPVIADGGKLGSEFGSTVVSRGLPWSRGCLGFLLALSSVKEVKSGPRVAGGNGGIQHASAGEFEERIFELNLACLRRREDSIQNGGMNFAGGRDTYEGGIFWEGRRPSRAAFDLPARMIP